jgi:hypothetical protein
VPVDVGSVLVVYDCHQYRPLDLYTRPQQCTGRIPIQTDGSINRMGMEFQDSGEDLCSFGYNINRSLSIIVISEQEDEQVLFSFTTSSGIPSGCFLHQLEQDVSICVPPSSDPGLSTSDDQQGVSSHCSHRSNMVLQGVVLAAFGTQHRMSPQNTFGEGSGNRRTVAFQPSPIVPGCLVISGIASLCMSYQMTLQRPSCHPKLTRENNSNSRLG